MWICNTLQLSHLLVSENLLRELSANPAIRVLGPPEELPFDASGNLVSVFETHGAARSAA
jgi:hypothetical protein